MLKSINSKIFFSYITLILLVLLAVGVFFTFLIEDYFIATHTREQEKTGQELTGVARSILTAGGEDHSQLLFLLDRTLEARIWIVNQQGKIIKSSRPEAQLGSESRIAPGDLETILQGEIFSRPASTSYFDTAMLSTGIPVEKGGRIIGGLFLHYPIIGIQNTLQQIQKNLLYAAIIAVIAAGMVSLGLARNLSRPILDINQSALAMAGGDFSRRVQISRPDELGKLGHSFNFLASRLDQTMSQLAGERDKLAHTVSSIEEGVIAVNQEGQIILSNFPAIALFRPDMTPEDFHLKDLATLINEPEIPGLFKKTLETGEKQSQLLEPEGHLSIFLQVFPIQNTSGSISGAVALLHNLKNLDGLEEIQRNFLAEVSHELKTPLTTIRSYSQALLDGTASQPEIRERFLQTICEETDSLTNLIKELLDYSRIKSGNISPRGEDFSPADLLAGVLNTRTGAIKERELTLVQDLPPDLPLIKADPALIQLVISNLLDNALTFTPPGGTITIRARVEEKKIWIAVADTGPGINEEDLPFIWKRFYRGQKGWQKKVPGWGLGLAISRDIIRAHGEEIKVSSREERGTTFSFSLPRS